MKDLSKYIVIDTSKFMKDAKKVVDARNMYSTLIPNSFRTFNTYAEEIDWIGEIELPERPGLIVASRFKYVCSLFDLDVENYICHKKVEAEVVEEPEESKPVDLEKVIEAIEYNSRLLMRLIDLWEK